MKRTDYKAALEEAQREMEELLQERMLLDMRLVHLKQTIDALTHLLAPKPTEHASAMDAAIAGLAGEPISDVGITDAIRQLLTESTVPLSPVQIRTKLMNEGFDLGDYANKMAVIHNTLKRLERQGEVMTVCDSSGQIIAYASRWQTEPTSSLAKTIMEAAFPYDHPMSVAQRHDKEKAERVAKAKEELRKKH